MGLMDVINGVPNGPRGQRQPSREGGGGMSPMMMAHWRCSPTRHSRDAAARLTLAPHNSPPLAAGRLPSCRAVPPPPVLRPGGSAISWADC